MWLKVLMYLPQIISAGLALYKLFHDVSHIRDVKDAIKVAQNGDFEPLKALLAVIEGK